MYNFNGIRIFFVKTENETLQRASQNKVSPFGELWNKNKQLIFKFCILCFNIHLSVKGSLGCENLFGDISHHLDLKIKNILVMDLHRKEDSTFHELVPI